MKFNIFSIILILCFFSCASQDKETEKLSITNVNCSLCNCLESKFDNKLTNTLIKYENKLISFGFLEDRSSQAYMDLISFILENDEKVSYLDGEFIHQIEPIFSLDSLFSCYETYKNIDNSKLIHLLINEKGSLRDRLLMLQQKYSDKDFDDLSSRYILLYLLGYMNTHVLKPSEVFVKDVKLFKVFHPSLKKKKESELKEGEYAERTKVFVNGEPMALITWTNYQGTLIKELNKDKEVLVIFDDYDLSKELQEKGLKTHLVKRYP